jgi:hypothetical protein
LTLPVKVSVSFDVDKEAETNRLDDDGVVVVVVVVVATSNPISCDLYSQIFGCITKLVARPNDDNTNCMIPPKRYIVDVFMID